MPTMKYLHNLHLTYGFIEDTAQMRHDACKDSKGVVNSTVRRSQHSPVTEYKYSS